MLIDVSKPSPVIIHKLKLLCYNSSILNFVFYFNSFLNEINPKNFILLSH